LPALGCPILLAGDTQKRSWKILKKFGILVSMVDLPSEGEVVKHAVRSALLSAQGGHHCSLNLQRSSIRGRSGRWFETVTLLCAARRARELNETVYARGKIVLKVA
jgi:hypothetical protein